MIVFYRVHAVTCTQRVFEMVCFVVCCPFFCIYSHNLMLLLDFLFLSLFLKSLSKSTERIFFCIRKFIAWENASGLCIIRGCSKRVFLSLRDCHDEVRRGSDRCERFLSLWESLSITLWPVFSIFRPFTGVRKWPVNEPMYLSPTICSAKKRRSRCVSPKRTERATWQSRIFRI